MAIKNSVSRKKYLIKIPYDGKEVYNIDKVRREFENAVSKKMG